MAVAWGEWVAILPHADASADQIEVQAFAVHSASGLSQSRSLVVSRDLLADLVGFFALGVLLPAALRTEDAGFAQHGMGCKEAVRSWLRARAVLSWQRGSSSC